MRRLKDFEEKRLSSLTEKSVEATLLEPTATGLGKSIMDATKPVRRYLLEKKIHDYERQEQGPKHKLILDAYIVDEKEMTLAKASLYRPKTKKGDPRIWFKGLKSHADPHDILAVIAYESQLFVINLTKTPVDRIIHEIQQGPLWEFLEEVRADVSRTSDELLAKLKDIARRGPVRSVLDGHADTAIGRTLETLLGININSSREPDYKGIELKSYRSREGSRSTRKTLFAKVANWNLSKLKSSREILEAFGYNRDGALRLNCTVSTQARNPQGLKFIINEEDGWLIENSDKEEFGNSAVWLLDDLRECLLHKHHETFWVAADSLTIDGIEHFQFKEVLHTKKPIASQFDVLLEQGHITMDHLIKRNRKGRVSERGPLFKIGPDALEMLFPPSETYDLLEKAS